VELEIETKRIKADEFLNQDCLCALDLESMLLAGLAKIPFLTVSANNNMH